ncbi:hypothetical protein ACX818_001335 [Acinetobacter baumannii]
MMTNKFTIDLPMLMRAMNFYQNRGYRPIPAPQCVNLPAIEMTLPKGRFAKFHDLKSFYVGSAEQSFYQLMDDWEKLGFPLKQSDGKFMMLTPCQRNEDVLDDSHFEIFLKLELISLDGWVNYDVLSFLSREGLDAKEVPLEDGTIDIELNGIEIGSYGMRTKNDIKIYYGTGLAMPRISYAKSMRRDKNAA